MDSRRPIAENPPRWQPNPDPSSIIVPGLDTSASVHDQIEQMEQLITLKLQNIDANFSKIHHLLANKVLPALKRYAVATEPVREAAKFWTSFYEQAAQIQIPTYDDYSTVNEESTRQSELSEMQDQPQNPLPTLPDDNQSHSLDPSMTSTNVSFMPGQGAFSSTPATERMTRMYNTSSATSGEPSWNVSHVSLNSPLARKDNFAQDLSAIEDDSILGPSDDESSMPSDEPTPIPIQSAKGKARDTKEPLLRNVLRHNLYPIDTSASFATTSPLKYRGKPKTPVPKKFNPFLSPDKDPSKWDGVVDLSDPSVMTPHRARKDERSHSRKGAAKPFEETDDDSFDGLPAGMSPPVMMSPARPPRSIAELGLLKLTKTPTRDASARIARDLVRDIQYGSGYAGGRSYMNSRVESTMSTLPTPPSLSRYRRDDTSDSIVIDSSLESMMRRVGLDVPSTVGSTPGLHHRSQVSQGASDPADALSPDSSAHDGELVTPIYQEDSLGMDSDSDSMDEMNDTAHPSQAFLMASAGGVCRDPDDSFDSNHSSDSLNDAEGLGAPIHPFAAANVVEDGFDDSFDDDMYDGEVQEETLFGVPPQQRMQRQWSNAGRHVDELRLFGGDLLEDTIGIGSQKALGGGVEESPTPAIRPGTSH
ncbi:hypothetical protein H0H92_001713 [Tricholoma furcatifolium]|nr:hypothetical protein H0H92_001713 [Tricholoma furcatifolium]